MLSVPRFLTSAPLMYQFNSSGRSPSYHSLAVSSHTSPFWYGRANVYPTIYGSGLGSLQGSNARLYPLLNVPTQPLSVFTAPSTSFGSPLPTGSISVPRSQSSTPGSTLGELPSASRAPLTDFKSDNGTSRPMMGGKEGGLRSREGFDTMTFQNSDVTLSTPLPSKSDGRPGPKVSLSPSSMRPTECPSGRPVLRPRGEYVGVRVAEIEDTLKRRQSSAAHYAISRN